MCAPALLSNVSTLTIAVFQLLLSCFCSAKCGKLSQSVHRTNQSASTSGGRLPSTRRGMVPHHRCGTTCHTAQTDPPATMQTPRNTMWPTSSTGVPTPARLVISSQEVIHEVRRTRALLKCPRLHRSSGPQFQSRSTTTSRLRPDPTSSGQATSLPARAWTRMAPSTSAACG